LADLISPERVLNNDLIEFVSTQEQHSARRFAALKQAREQIHADLKRMWLHLGDVAMLAVDIDRAGLSRDDMLELERIERLNYGFAGAVMDMSAKAKMGKRLSIEEVKAFSFLIQTHCEECVNAMTIVINAQNRNRSNNKA
jgi:hypothetical protein